MSTSQNMYFGIKKKTEEIKKLKQQLVDKTAECDRLADEKLYSRRKLEDDNKKLQAEVDELKKANADATNDCIKANNESCKLIDQLTQRDQWIKEARYLFKQNFSEGEGEDYSPIDAFMEKTKDIK